MLPRYTPIAAALLAVFSFPCSSTKACAQEIPKESTLPEIKVRNISISENYATDTIIMGGKTIVPLRDVPQSVTVINRAVLDAQGVASLPDALRNVPGITLGGGEGGYIGNNINLRGFSARTDLYIDGVRDRGQYYRDTFYLEEIEVLKGPSSMLFGRGATGGVINQVSKQASLRARQKISAVVGTSNIYRIVADANQPLSDTAALRINLMGQNIGSTRDGIKNKDVGIASTLRIGINTPTTITLSALLQHNRDIPDYGLLAVNGRPVTVNKDNTYGLKDDRTIQDIATFSARVEHKISSTLRVQNQIQYSYYTTDARVTTPNSVGFFDGKGAFTTLNIAAGNPTTLPLERLFFKMGSVDRTIHDQSLYNQTDLTHEFETGTMKHSLLTGLEIGRDTYENQSSSRNNLPIVPVNNSVSLFTPENSVTSIGNLAKSTANTFAVYINDTLELNKQWKLVGGMRWDRYQAKIHNSINSSNKAGNTSLPEANQTVYFTSVRAGILYQPDDMQSYYVSYGTSFNPSLEQLTLKTGQQNLLPEKNTSYEAGGKWELLEHRLSLALAAFQIDKVDARWQISPGVYHSMGNVRVRGLEASVAGWITPRWQVIGGFTYLDPKVLKAASLDGGSDKMLANTPRNSLTLWNTYSLTPEWEIGGGMNYMSNRFANNSNTVAIDSYMRFDATMAYRQPKYIFRLNLLNATDRRDFIAAVPSKGGRAIPDTGRTVQITFTYQF